MERRTIAVRGIVQGVGFRPFVYALASRLDLRGFVLNQTGGVRIEVEGAADSLDSFLTELTTHPPPLAKIEFLAWDRQAPRGDSTFRIQPSDASTAGPVFVAPDVATCDTCLAELFDPTDRHFHYPFLNCTNCGPRLTIIRGTPYDRWRTTMDGFPMCTQCRREYENPADRRFHAQPTACPACGPRLSLLDSAGNPIAKDDPLGHFVVALLEGRIGALKGLGGYHLACDVRNDGAVAELRRRKHRDEKPFAVMVGAVGAAEALCEIAPAERALLVSQRRPIVLLRMRTPVPIARGIALDNPLLGVMLPYTPLHHLLLQAVRIPLVMTSGNRADEPIAVSSEEAIEKLAGIADIFLTHDRPIHVRCDDSVTRVVAGEELPVRRSRGYAPTPVEMPFECPRSILAVGGQLKATFALGRGRFAFLSHHLGDLDHYEAFRAFLKDVVLYEELFGAQPSVLAHDLHPDYGSTRYAVERAAREGARTVPVQHHHAHVASCMAENGLNEPVIGVAFDGTGHGTDGAVWGGEFLVAEYHQFRRAAHLRNVGMPGGERAIREPWRMAVAHLIDAGEDVRAFETAHGRTSVRTIEKMLARKLNSPLTSSVGRLFDAVASLAGLRDRASYEGQAAMELEWRATGVDPDGVYPFEVNVPGGDAPLVVDTRPTIREVASDARRSVEASRIARRFHSTLAELIADVCGRLRTMTGLNAVVLSGGVFLNALLTREVCARLGAEGFRVYRHRLVPPGDGGLSLGQLAVAARSAGA
jgi:hydrogenase maturation protein HypF